MPDTGLSERPALCSLTSTEPSVWRSLLSRRMLANLFFGFSSGLPLYITGSTLQAWMTDERVNLGVVGLFSLVGLPYTLKFLWAPLIDRFVPPFLGRRRGWILTAQLGLAVSVAIMSLSSPSLYPWRIAMLALVVAFVSATQDISVDAYRREVLPDAELGLGSSMYVNGYRIGMLVTGSLALIAADHLPWHTVYLLLAVLFLIISPLTLLAPDPQERSFPPATLRQAVIEPFAEYFRRRSAIEVLVFLLLYKIDDAMALNLQTRFFLEMGFSKTDIGAVGKTFGLAATLFGVFVGGAAILRWGLRKCLWVFGLCQAAGTAGLAILSIAGKSVAMLTGAIVVDYFAAAMATAVILTFMARLTNKSFTATQYALLSSLAVVPRVILSAPTGYLAGHIGWSAYFLFCALAAVPALALLFRFDTWKEALS